MVRRYGGAFLQRYAVPPGVVHTLRELAACRTKALGGHVAQCRGCGHVNYHYHSCGNRHCPQCGGIKRAQWLDKRTAELLPVPYFHVVFTLPHTLSALALGNRKKLYQMLFNAASAALLEIAADPKHLGARIGILMVLHTWGQQLEHHPHVHCVVPGGGVSPDGTRWVASRRNFFLSVKVLGRLFRGKYLAALRQAYDSGELKFAGSTAPLANAKQFNAFLRRLYQADWVVYAKKPFAGPERMLKYLARYTHRAAISNGRLVKLENDCLTFTWKDYTGGCRSKEMTLDALEFLRRFAMHILPRGFVRIRQYGLLANRDRSKRLDQCRRLLAAAGPAAPQRCTSITPTDEQVKEPQTVPTVCTACGAAALQLIWHAERPHAAHLQSTCSWDTS